MKLKNFSNYCFDELVRITMGGYGAGCWWKHRGSNPSSIELFFNGRQDGKEELHQK